MTCGCCKPNKRHGDSRNITLLDLQGAAEAAKTDIHHVVANIMECYDDDVKGTDLMDAKKELGVTLLKSSDEQRYTLGVAYAAYLPDVGKAADGYQDFVGADALEKAAWSYMRKGGSVGIHHQNGTEGRGQVTESYIYRGPDWHVNAADGSTQVIKAGDWLLGVVWQPETWQEIKAGLINGFSPQGSAKRGTPSAESIANLRR